MEIGGSGGGNIISVIPVVGQASRLVGLEASRLVDLKACRLVDLVLLCSRFFVGLGFIFLRTRFSIDLFIGFKLA